MSVLPSAEKVQLATLYHEELERSEQERIERLNVDTFFDKCSGKIKEGIEDSVSKGRFDVFLTLSGGVLNSKICIILARHGYTVRYFPIEDLLYLDWDLLKRNDRKVSKVRKFWQYGRRELDEMVPLIPLAVDAYARTIEVIKNYYSYSVFGKLVANGLKTGKRSFYIGSGYQKDDPNGQYHNFGGWEGFSNNEVWNQVNRTVKLIVSEASIQGYYAEASQDGTEIILRFWVGEKEIKDARSSSWWRFWGRFASSA